MANWWNNVKKAKASKNDRRFLTAFDMAEAKRADSILNSKIKRGELKKGNTRSYYVCNCGVTGCIGCNEYDI